MRQIEIAVTYASMGIPVFPVTQSKRPVTKNGFLDATTDTATVRKWWRKNPNYLIGCPNSMFTVLDIDDHGTCDAGKILTENALHRLFSEIPSNAVIVRTMSGGRHIYFKRNTEAKRRINALPNIDLLGDGGFVILPDQKKYVADRPLWENVNSLPEFDLESFNSLSSDMEHASKLARDLKREYKRGKSTKTASEIKKTKLSSSEVVAVSSPVISTKKSVDYETGEVNFDQVPDMYKKNSDYETDPTILDKFDENGVLRLNAGELNSARINTLFHTPYVQEKLGKLLGLNVPACGDDRTLMRSVLPGHPDIRPSMGVRWDKWGTHILIRDFSNHFCDNYNQLDYNVVRLYSTIRYKALAPRLNPPEFVVWFLRMMVEAGILDVTHLKKKYSVPRFGKNGVWRVAEGFLLLDAIKSLYDGYDGKSVFTDRFCAAWCGMDPASVNRCKKSLVEGGYLYVEGEHDCSVGYGKGVYKTKIYSVMDRVKISEINKGQSQYHEGTGMKNEHVTLRGISISEPSYLKVVNFCKDYKISGVPMRKNMFSEVITLNGLDTTPPPQTDGSVVITDLRLVVAPKMKGDGEVLIVSGECPELEELFASEQEKFDFSDVYTDEAVIGFVISSDFSENALDLDTLELRLRDYLGNRVVMDTFFIRYGTSESIIDYVFDGEEPPGE